MLIEVFVRSNDRYVDIEFYREMSYHWQCGLDKWAMDGLTEQFKGRILSENDVKILEQVLEIAKAKNQHVKVYDVSRVKGKIEAMKRGILKTPTLIIDDRKYHGSDKILEAISSKLGWEH